MVGRVVQVLFGRYFGARVMLFPFSIFFYEHTFCQCFFLFRLGIYIVGRQEQVIVLAYFKGKITLKLITYTCMPTRTIFFDKIM